MMSHSAFGLNSLPGFSRRGFLKAAGAAAMLPATSRWAEGRPPASDRITLGVIGWGEIGPSNAKAFLANADCQVVAACDLDGNRLATATGVINTHYGNKDCRMYRDYHELLDRDDIDAVMIAVPDHNHALLAIDAANAKKDVYGEKPLARTIAEQQAIVRAAERNNIIWQMGSWQRSYPNFHKAAEIVRNGLIGNVTRVEVGLPTGPKGFAGAWATKLQAKLATVPGVSVASPYEILPGTAAWDVAVDAAPPQLDYETWMGPSQREAYIEARTHDDWRWNYNTGGGPLMDWIGHHGDIAHWGLGFDATGPSEIEGHGEFPSQLAMWNTTSKYKIECTYRKEVTGYPVDVVMTIAGGYPEITSGTKWYGTDGWVWVDRGKFDASNKDWVPMVSLPDDLRKTKLYESVEHRRNFLDCVKSRKPTITPAATGHHSTIPGHLGLISMLVGRKIYWDPVHEIILNDWFAGNLLSRPYREPYKLLS
jgi:predicted dehydrogenase